MTDVLLCVGNSMMGDDGAGPLLAEMCAANPQGNWVVIDGGSAPENDVVAIRELHPDRLLIVDATDMGLNPGDIRLIDPDDIADMFMMTTHNMPLNYLVDQIKEDVGEVLFLGIQPDIVGFYYPMTPPVKAAVEVVYSRLGGWAVMGGFESLSQLGRGFFLAPPRVVVGLGAGHSLRQIRPVTRNHLLIPPERFLAFALQRAISGIVAVNVDKPVALAHFAR